MSQSEMNKRIALELLKEAQSENDIVSLINQEKIFSILEKTQQKEYLNCLEPLEGNKDQQIHNLILKEKFLYDSLLKEIEKRIQFNVELVKHGHKMDCTVNRWAVIIYPEGIWSVKEPLRDGQAFNKNKAKDKTPKLESCSFFLEDQKTVKNEWIVKNKQIRLRISFQNEKKKVNDQIYLYFESYENARRAEHLLNLIKYRKKDKILSSQVENSVKYVNNSNIMYALMKILAVKDMVKEKKSLLSTFKSKYQSERSSFKSFMESSFLNLVEKYKQKKQKVIKNEEIEEKINKKIYLSTSLKSYKKQINMEFSDMKESMNDLIFHILENKDENITESTENVAKFKINELKSIMKYGNLDVIEKLNHLSKLSGFVFNTKNNEITFMDSKTKENISLTENVLNSISSIQIDSDLNGKYNENSIILNGPKIESQSYTSYRYKDNKIYNNKLNVESSFIDPEYHGLVYNATASKNFKSVYLQIFHMNIEISIDKISSFFGNKLSNLEKDLGFIIEISIESLNIGSFKKSTSVKNIKQADTSHTQFIIEFNSQFLVNLNSIQYDNMSNQDVLFELKVLCINKHEINNKHESLLSSYVKRLEISKIQITKEAATRNSFSFSNSYSKNVDSLFNNIILNFVYNSQLNNDEIDVFHGKSLSIGSTFYIKDILDRQKIESLKGKSGLCSKILNQLNAVEYDNDDYIILRLPNQYELEKINLPDQSINDKIKTDLTEEIQEKIINSKEANFLPHVQVYTSQSDLNTRNLCLENKELFKNQKQNSLIYRLPYITKNFLCEFKGITKNNELVYYNYFTNSIETMYLYKIKDQINSEFTLNSNLNLSIYDFNQIEKYDDSNNHQWKLQIKLVNDIEKKVFIYYFKYLLSKIRQSKATKVPASINEDLIHYQNSDLKNDLRTLKIIIEKIEFRQHFKIENKCEISIKSLKTSDLINPTQVKRVSISNQGKYLLELLSNDPSSGYRNTIMESSELQQDLDLLMAGRFQEKILNKKFSVEPSKFNSSHKIFKFSNEVPDKDKTLEYEVKPNIDKIIGFEMVLTDEKGKECILSNYSYDFDQIIKCQPQADLLYIPLFLNDPVKADDTSSIEVVLTVNVFSTNYGNSKDTFRSLFEKCLSSIENPIDAYGNRVKLGKFEPNVFKRKILKDIENKLNLNSNLEVLGKEVSSDNDKKELLCGYLLEKEIQGAVELYKNSNILLWKQLIVNYPKYHIKTVKKFYCHYKRNEFFFQFGNVEWIRFFNELFIKFLKPKNPNLEFKNIDPYSLFPIKSDLIKWKITNNSWYSKIKSLFYKGIPNDYRIKIWNHILDIEGLALLTNQKVEIIKDSTQIKESFNELFAYFVNKSNSTFNINFSLIDSDLSLLHTIGKDENLINIEEISNRQKIRQIAKAYFSWTELGIYTDKYTSREGKKYVYFTGILKIIQKLLSIYKSEYEIFWIIIGFSQNIDAFYQENPLFSNVIGNNKAYILAINLILQDHLSDINSKIQSLNFPIDFFIADKITSFFSNHLESDLFLRLMDILLFESSFKLNEYDSFDTIRIICSIPLTLIELCKKSILETKSVRELETVFKNMIKKTFNVENFIQILTDNINKYFFTSNLINKLIDIGGENKWDHKRERLDNHIQNTFSKIKNENIQFLSGLFGNKVPITAYNLISKSSKYLSLINKEQKEGSMENIESLTYSFNDFTISNFEENLDKELNSIRNVYSTGTVKGGSHKPYRLLFGINKVSIFNKPQKERTFYINLIFDSKMLLSNQHLSINTKRETITFNSEGLNKSPEIKEYKFDSLPKYLNITLFNKENGEFFTSFSIDIIKKDLMRPIKFFSESNDSLNKSILEVGIYKYSKVQISEEDTKLYRLIFQTPEILFNMNSFDELTEINKEISQKISSFEKIISSTDEKRLVLFKNQNEDEKNPFNEDEFQRHAVEIYEKLKVSLLKNNIKENISQRLRTIVSSSFDDNKSLSEFVFNWLEHGNSTFEEIMISLVLADSSSITVQEKLKLIFSFGRMQNYLIYNEDKINEEKFKSLIYSLYKRFMVNLSKNDTDRMVDFSLNRDSLHNFRNVLLFSDSFSSEILDFINKDKPLSNKILGEKEGFIDILKVFTLIVSLLKNKYDIAFLSKELTISIIDSIVKIYNKKITDNSITNLCLETVNQGIRSLKLVALSMENGNFIPNFVKYQRDFVFHENVESRLYADLLQEVLNELEIYNNDTDDISYEKYLNIIGSLPLIGDLIRATCGFINQEGNKKKEMLTKEISKLRFEIKSNETSYSFLFFDDFDRHLYKNNENTHYFNMNERVRYDSNPSDILKKIYSYIGKENIKNKYILEGIYENLGLLNVFYKNTKGIDEEIRIFDPLYSNIQIKSKLNTELHLIVKIESNLNVSILDNNELIPLQKGFSLLENIDGESSVWFECKVKNNHLKGEYANDYREVMFPMFENKFYFKINKDKVIVQELDKN